MIIKTIEAHTMGEPLRAVVDGLPAIIGHTMLEKQQYFVSHYDKYRRGLLLEPHGHRDMFGAILTDKVHDNADLGVLFMNTQSMEPMCGHGSIAMAVIAVKYGYVEKKEPVTTVKLDVPAGIVTIDVAIRNDKISGATLKNVESYMVDEDIKVDIGSNKVVCVDVAYGGNCFALVNAEKVGIELDTEHLKNIINLGMRIKEYVNRGKGYDDVLGTLFYQENGDKAGDYKDIVIFGKGSIDRSPCGTGASALYSMLRAKNVIKENTEITVKSVFGGTFKIRSCAERRENNRLILIPQVVGNAYVIGESKHFFNEDDPLIYGLDMS